MSDLARFVRHLAETAAARDPSLLRTPLPLSELLGRIMPYRACRRALGLATVEEYELLVLRVLAGEEGLADVSPPEAAERCRAELAGVHPDVGLVRTLEEVTLRLDLGALGRAAPADRPAPPVPAPSPQPTVLDEAPVHAEPSHLSQSAPPNEEPMSADSPAAAPTDCPHCAAALPRGREVRFCPHCGGNVRTRKCAACGTELELEWRHCVLCGQAVGDSGRLA